MLGKQYKIILTLYEVKSSVIRNVFSPLSDSIIH